MNFKKLLSIILSISILLVTLPLTTFAENPPQTQNMEISSNEVSLKGTNSVGNMIAAELEEAATQDESSGNVIYSVEIDIDSAYVELSTAVECTLFVGIYTEDTATLLTSGYTMVTPEDENTFVDLEHAVPDYFYIKAFLVDSEDYAPLSAVYNSPMYTQEMQEFFSKTTDDFDQEKVVNFDEDKTNNFAVLSDEVLILDKETETNEITYADVNAQIYILENIDETVSSLNVGDTFSGYYKGELFIITVGEIATEGTTATILGTEAELEEVFDYVRLDSATGITEGMVDENACGEGITFTGYEKPAATYGMRAVDIEESIGLDAKFEIDLFEKGTDSAKVSVTGNFNLNFVFAPKLYISLSYQYVELKFDYKLSGGISISGETELEVPIVPLTFGLPGLRADVTPDFVLSASGSVELEGTLLKGTLGYGWYSDVGGINLCSTPKMEVEIKAEIKIFVGLRIAPKILALEGALLDAGLEANLGVEATASLSGNTSDLFDKSKKHACAICVDGEICGKFDLSVVGDLCNNEDWSLDWKVAEIKIKIADFYWSMTHGEFGFTTCPHLSYKLEVVVSDNSGKAITDATVNLNGNTYTTGKSGGISTFLPNGKYTVTVSKEDFDSEEKTVHIKDDSKTININISVSSSVTIPQKLSLGTLNSAAIMQNGDLYMWGNNESGHLGDGTKTNKTTPVKILSNVESVSLGESHSAAITRNGDLYMWGYNYYGELGDGTTPRTTPVKVMSNIASVSLGSYYSAAVTTSGDLYVWGANYAGQVGDGSINTRYTPVKIMSNVASVCLGMDHSSAITTNGNHYTWGSNYHGQLGDTTTSTRVTPLKIMSNVASVSLGTTHSAAVTKSGDLYTWGNNNNGQLGNGSTTKRTSPSRILGNIAKVSLGGYHSAAITTTGDLYTWGHNGYSQLGDGTKTARPTPKKIMENVADVELGRSHSSVITMNGDAYLWGNNYSGQIGDGTTTDRATPFNLTIFPLALMSSISTRSVALYNTASTKTTESLETSSFESLEPNTIYNFYIMKDRSSDTAFSEENLLYINQAVTDENGVAVFEFANGADFEEAEKFVVKFKNAMPENTVSDIVVTANAKKIFVNVASELLLNGNYENIKAKVSFGGEKYEITEYIKGENNLLFVCNTADETEDNSVISIQLFADYKGSTYECDEYHRTLFESQIDVNADGEINALDLSGLKTTLFNGYTDDALFDPNADGKINILDLIRLKNHLINA